MKENQYTHCTYSFIYCFIQSYTHSPLNFHGKKKKGTWCSVPVLFLAIEKTSLACNIYVITNIKKKKKKSMEYKNILCFPPSLNTK